jgi:hypothetical protein
MTRQPFIMQKLPVSRAVSGYPLVRPAYHSPVTFVRWVLELLRHACAVYKLLDEHN